MNTYNIRLREDRTNANSLVPLVFVSTNNRKQFRKTLDYIKVNPKEWDKIKSCLKPSPQNDLINLKLNQIKQKAEGILIKLRLEEKQLTGQEFYEAVFEVKAKKTESDFYDFYDFFLKIKNYPIKHWESYTTLKEQLKAFKPNLKFSEIDYSFCVSFNFYLEDRCKNGANTRLKKIQYLRCILSEAIKHKKMTENPAQEIKIKTTPTNRTALTMKEVEALEQLYDKGVLTTNQLKVLQYFLFSCYTGLRYSDLQKFSVFNIENGVIKIIQSKTGSVVSIPLLDRARRFLPINKFDMLSNQKSNDNLKTITKGYTNIRGNVTCHVGRHTFATIGLNSGIPLEVVSEILGHSSTRVTKRYAKMLDGFKVLEMAKWGNTTSKKTEGNKVA